MRLTRPSLRRHASRAAGALAAAFAVALLAPADAALAQVRVGSSSQQRLLATDPGSGTQVWVTETPQALEFRTQGNVYVSISYNIDRDANGALDPEIDATYGSNQDNPCAQRVLRGGWSACGGLATGGSFSRLQVGDLMVTKWVIPLQELVVRGDTFGVSVAFYDRNTQRSEAVRVYYRFGLGVVAGPAPRQPGQGAPDADEVARQGRLFDAVFAEAPLDTVANGSIAKVGSVRTTGCQTQVQAPGERWTLDWKKAEPLESSNDILAIDAGAYVVLSAYQRRDLIVRLINAGQRLRTLCGTK